MKPLLSAVFLGFLLQAGVVQAKDVIPTLSVQGHAEIGVPADQVEFRIGVQSQAGDTETVLTENSRKMDGIIAALKAKGLSDDDFQTGQFSINPQWQSRPKNPPSDWAPTIIGYRANNQIVVTTGEFEKVGDWIAAAAREGANTVGQLRFGLENADAHRSEAITQAVAKAKGYAEAAAEAAGVRLKDVLSIQVNGAHMQPLIRGQVMQAEMVMAKSDAMVPAIDPGEIQVNASVSLSYELR